MKNNVVENTSIEPYLLVTENALEAMVLFDYWKDEHSLPQNYEYIVEINIIINDLSKYWKLHR